MAKQADAPAPVAPAADAPPLSAGDRFKDWFLQEGAWWGTSFVFHAVLLLTLMLISTTAKPRIEDDAIAIDAATTEKPEVPQDLEKFEVGETPIDNAELTTDTLTMSEAQVAAGDDQVVNAGGGRADAPATGPQLGGLGGFSISAVGPGVANQGKGGVGGGHGKGDSPGAGGSGTGFAGRSSGAKRAMVGGFGGTKQSERAVAAALSWLARHQNKDGSWSLSGYTKQCKDTTCTGPGNANSDAGATAMALLPFLAAGQTHESRGPYKATIYNGLYWLVRNQKRDGSVFAGTSAKMYTHSLVSIALCEAYGLTGDKVLGQAAQSACGFLESTQHKKTGGWRYQPGDEGDTSVVGWCTMALKSAKMSGLNVSDESLNLVKKWLDTCARGSKKGLYCYVPIDEKTLKEAGPNPSMTAVGSLLRQYMGMKPDDPSMQEGIRYLMNSIPKKENRQLYHWYYATQVMHNVPGPDWDAWNRAMRRALIETQVKEGCATGSWDPFRPNKGHDLEAGGRIYAVALSTLTLEVYYRYLPLYKLDQESAAPASALNSEITAAADKKDAKPAEKKEEKKDEKPAKK